MGALYAQLTRPQSPASAVATGAAYGLAVWTGSYCGWLPAVGLYRPPTQDTVERTALMIGAHLVWGGATGLLVHWLKPLGGQQAMTTQFDCRQDRISRTRTWGDSLKALFWHGKLLAKDDEPVETP